MSTKGAPENLDPNASAPPPAGAATPPVATPPAPSAVTPPAANPPATAQAAPPTADPTPAKPGPITLGDDDDEIPEGASLLQLSRNALSKRLDRATKKELKAKFGTDNYDEIKAKLEKAAEYERTQEEQRRAQLSEVERAKEDAKQWERRYVDLETKVKNERRAQVISTEHSRVTTIAKEFLDADYLDTELPIFAREILSKYSRAEAENLGDDAIRAYFQKRIEAKPKLGKDFAPSAPPPAAKPAPTEVPATNGVRENERPTARTEGSGLPVNGDRTFKPGLPNSMSTQEAKAAAGAQGFRW